MIKPVIVRNLILSSAALALSLAIAPGYLEVAQAKIPLANQDINGIVQARLNTSPISIEFQPPGDSTPRDTTGGGTRGVQFQPIGDQSPKDTTGGGTRGQVKFIPPVGDTPSNTTGGGTRSAVRFAPPGGDAPSDTTGGGTRDVRFDPPGDNSPSSTMGGGTRTDELSVFIPLLPATKQGRTASARPTFFVYVPQGTRRQIFFSLQDTQRNHVYQTTFEISGKPGIVSFTLPADAPALEVGKDYLWFFAVVEPGQVLRPDNYTINGWIKRVEPPTIGRNGQLTPLEAATLYAKSGIWYDTVALLASARLAKPDDTTLTTEWKSLLGQVGLDRLAPIPFTEQF